MAAMAACVRTEEDDRASSALSEALRASSALRAYTEEADTEEADRASRPHRRTRVGPAMAASVHGRGRHGLGRQRSEQGQRDGDS